MNLRLSSVHQLYAHEITQIESDVSLLSSSDIKSITSSGKSSNTLLIDIQAGKILLLSDSPKSPLFQYNDKQQLIVSDHNASQYSVLLENLSDRFTWLLESEVLAENSINGISQQHEYSHQSQSLQPSGEVVYNDQPVVEDAKPFKWTIFINEELYRFSTKHHDLNHGLSVRIKDDLGGEHNLVVTGYKVTVMLSDEVSELTLTFFPEGNDPATVSEEMWPETVHKKMLGNSVKFTQSDWHDGKPGVVSLRIPAAKGAILHPSLTCPVLGNPDQVQPVSLLLALEKDFITNQFVQDKDTVKDGDISIGGPWVRRAIHTQLCCNPIAQQKNTKRPNDLPLFKRHSIAVDSMQVYHLGSLTGERQLINNHKGEAWTVLRESSAKWYTEKSFTELVQVDIDPAALADLVKGGSSLYDLAWTCLNDEGEAFFVAPDQNYPDNPHIEQQDIEQGSWQQQGNRYKQGVYSFDSIKDCNRDNIKALAIDTSVNEKGESPSVKQRHPLYLSSKPLLNPGQLTDVHISSRQHIYTASKAQVIPGASPKDSPYLGDLCNINFLTLKNLMDQMGKNKDVDVLVFTGDLVDYCVNLDPEQCQGVSNTGGIWEYMTEDKEQDETAYPKYIDDLMAFGLFDYFLVTYKKPIILISGNHEAYDLPYGISPRRFGNRANAGIPADHNLTIYEACLLYGDEYGHLNKDFNFEAGNFEWFYQIFCPMSDFILSHDRQQWVGLEWGDGEDFMETMVAGGGMLPRATESCNQEQLDIVQQASMDEDKPERLLLTHFTLVNFPTDAAITDMWKINTDDVSIKYEDFMPETFPPVLPESGDRDNGEEGSFHKGRKELYQEHVLTGRFKYCLAGHSHRAGLYDVSNIQPSTFEATGMLPQNYVPKSFPEAQPRILVSGSGGPVSKQNQGGELAGQGMDASQGTWIDVIKDKFHVVTADKNQVPQAHPRFAVALDYMELVAGKKIFQSFKASDIEKGEFEIVLNKTLPSTSFIDTIKLHYVNQSTLEPVGNLSWDIRRQERQGQVTLTLSSKEWSAFYYKTDQLSDTNDLAFYISVHFNSDLSKHIAYQAYQFDSPWCYPVQLKHHLKVTYQGFVLRPEHWSITRNAEEPSGDDYQLLADNRVEYT